MQPILPEHQRHQRKVSGRDRWRFLLVLACLGLAALTIGLLVFEQSWFPSTRSRPHPTPSPVGIFSPTPSPTSVSTPIPTASLESRINAYIDHLTPTQQIGQLLMLAVYTNGYTSALNQPLQQWDIANAVLYNQYNGGPLMPATRSAWTQLAHDLQAHANQALIIATDEEGGDVDRLASYYGPTPSPQQLAATGDPGAVYGSCL